MSTPSAYYLLGTRAEYLKGISSISIQHNPELQKYPPIMQNHPAFRYSVTNVVEQLGGFLKQLDELELTKTADAAAGLQPMLKEMQEALKNSPQPQQVTLRDPWAARLIENVRSVLAVLGIELAEKS